jgi:hypothetical protein
VNDLQWLCSIGLPVLPGDGATATVLKVHKTVTIDAAPDAVWDWCGNFNPIEAWLSVAAKTTLVRGKNNVPGAQRRIDVKGGGIVEEELLAYDAGGHAFEYRILGGVLPVSDYRSTFTAKADGAHRTVVTWSSTFKRKDTGPHPAADANDETALGAIDGLYATGLADLKRVVENG